MSDSQSFPIVQVAFAGVATTAELDVWAEEGTQNHVYDRDDRDSLGSNPMPQFNTSDDCSALGKDRTSTQKVAIHAFDLVLLSEKKQGSI